MMTVSLGVRWWSGQNLSLKEMQLTCFWLLCTLPILSECSCHLRCWVCSFVSFFALRASPAFLALTIGWLEPSLRGTSADEFSSLRAARAFNDAVRRATGSLGSARSMYAVDNTASADILWCTESKVKERTHHVGFVDILQRSVPDARSRWEDQLVVGLASEHARPQSVLV